MDGVVNVKVRSVLSSRGLLLLIFFSLFHSLCVYSIIILPNMPIEVELISILDHRLFTTVVS